MKKNISILLLLLLPLMLLAQKEAKPIKVACVGNSITEGFALAQSGNRKPIPPYSNVCWETGIR